MATITWQSSTVKSPHLPDSIAVIVARGFPYTTFPNRFQNLNIYLPQTHETVKFVDQTVYSLPALPGTDSSFQFPAPKHHVHIHGGAWRDPDLTAESIEPAVAHIFSDKSNKIQTVISLNYTLTHFPTHPEQPYHTILNNRSDPARDARHPDHIRDVLHGFKILRELGLKDNEYILTGHSAGACLAFQAVLASPEHWGVGMDSGFGGLPSPPRPAALLGLNGLYDLSALAHGLGSSHAHLRGVYANFLTHTFGPDVQGSWAVASPVHFDTDKMAARVKERKAPNLVILGQSMQDQLVPVNQRQRMELQLNQVNGLKVVLSERCTGVHAAPWEQGHMIWESVTDALELLENRE